MNKNLIIKKARIDFDYSMVDKETEEMMKKAVTTMRAVTQNTRKVLGEQLYKVQEKLAGNNQYDGIFGKWYRGLGLKKDVVYNCINYYKVLVANPDNQKLETLQFSKVCEVARLQENVELQKDVIEKVELDKMKLKQIEKLVSEVKDKQELTEEMIENAKQEDNNSKSSVDKFVKVGNDFIEMLEEQSQDIKQEDIESVLQLVEKVKNLCFVSEVNNTEHIEVNEEENKI